MIALAAVTGWSKAEIEDLDLDEFGEWVETAEEILAERQG